MSRSIKKGPYVESALMKRIVEMNKSGKKNVVKTWSRSSTIFPDFVGQCAAADAVNLPRIDDLLSLQPFEQHAVGVEG